jgi:hypothetical protein
MNEHLTKEDLTSHIDRIVKALEKSGVRDLVNLTKRLSELVKTVDRRKYNMPFGLIQEPKNGRVEFTTQPNICCRLTHLVLSPETAKSYEMEHFQIANIYSTGDDHHIPLELFSIEYMNDDRLANCMQWKTVELSPANRFTISASLRTGFSPVEFRGILWAEYEWDL